MTASRLDQNVIEGLQKFARENLDHRRFRPRALLVIGELDRVADIADNAVTLMLAAAKRS